tara:strand:- start:128 stop:637 length:510 start_codon:yes stop_codon:yes gene_type:complete
MESQIIDDLIKELDEIENKVNNNIDKIDIIIIKINNNEIENIIKKKQTKKPEISIEFINEILNKIKDKYCKNEYTIKYLLNFEINKNIYEINNLKNTKNEMLKSEDKLEVFSSDNNYKLNILNKIQKIKYNNDNFNNVNSLIFILNKLEKIHYIKRKQKKHNATKKLNK